nr:MAG TPA: hypothetical protein [Caudoviricetes sp.]
MRGLFGPKLAFQFWPLFGHLTIFGVTDVTSVTRRWQVAKTGGHSGHFFFIFGHLKTLKLQRKVGVVAKWPLFLLID